MTKQNKLIMQNMVSKLAQSEYRFILGRASSIKVGSKLKVKLDGTIFDATLVAFNDPTKTKLVYTVDAQYPGRTRTLAVAPDEIIKVI